MLAGRPFVLNGCVGFIFTVPKLFHLFFLFAFLYWASMVFCEGGGRFLFHISFLAAFLILSLPSVVICLWLLYVAQFETSLCCDWIIVCVNVVFVPFGFPAIAWLLCVLSPVTMSERNVMVIPLEALSYRCYQAFDFLIGLLFFRFTIRPACTVSDSRYYV